MAGLGNRRGGGAIKLIITILVLVYAGLAGWRYFSVRVAHYEFKDAVKEQLKFSQHKEIKEIVNELAAKAKELDLPIEADALQCAKTGNQVRCKVDYKTPYEIPGYSTQLSWSIDESFTQY